MGEWLMSLIMRERERERERERDTERERETDPRLEETGGGGPDVALRSQKVKT